MKKLKAGNRISYTGTIYTARDQAHKRLAETIKKKKELPVDLKNAIIYYCGPTPAPRGKAIGSCGLLRVRAWTVLRRYFLRPGLRV